MQIGDDLKKLMDPKEKEWPSGVVKGPGNGTLTTETKELRPVCRGKLVCLREVFYFSWSISLFIGHALL
jgi:hypothetical protein